MSADGEMHPVQYPRRREWWLHDYLGTMPCLMRWERRSVLLRWIDRFLRGISEVVFMNNPITGLLIIIAIVVSGDMGWWYALMGVIGTIASTLAWFLLDPEHNDGPDLDAGLYGFNGFLVGEAMGNFVSSGDNLDGGFGVIMLVVLLSVLATMVQKALGNVLLLQKNGLPALTLPFNLMTLMLLMGSYEYKRIYLTSSLDAHIPLKAGLGTGELGQTSQINLCFRELITDNCTSISEGATQAIFRGVAQIFFCDSLLAGVIILAGIFLSSRISCVFAVVGSAIGLATSVAFGVDGFNSYHGIWGYNAALSCMALGGFFVHLNKRVTALALFSAVITTALQGAIAAMFQPWGVPPFTLPFCIATLSMLAAMPSIKWMRPVEAPTFPEEHIKAAKRETKRRYLNEEHGSLLQEQLELQETDLRGQSAAVRQPDDKLGVSGNQPEQPRRNTHGAGEDVMQAALTTSNMANTFMSATSGHHQAVPGFRHVQPSASHRPLLEPVALIPLSTSNATVARSESSSSVDMYGALN